MDKGKFKNFFLAKTTHRLPKVITLAVSSCLLAAVVNIDTSASAVGGRDSNSVRSDVVSTLESSNLQFSGLVQRWSTVSSILPTTPPATTTSTASGGGGGPETSTTTAPPTTTPSASGGLITAGPSRSECLIPPTSGNTLPELNAAVNSFEALTNSTVTCIGSYTAPTNWAQWDDPWVIGPDGTAYTGWVAQNPKVNQIVLAVNLIPGNLQNTNNPLGWEQSCAAGDFNSYATKLGANLVAAGLGKSVLRLGQEMNGPWEPDFMGTTTQEQNLWAQCFANEVTGLRQAAGENFLIDWNPNACYQNVPFANFYPGNAYVDIMGLDLYNVGCDAPTTALAFPQLASEPGGLTSFEAFATAKGKPMSLPEWGLDSSPSGDDPGYINGIGSTVANGNFAFQEYFDVVNGGTLMLGSNTPLSNAAYQRYFGNS